MKTFESKQKLTQWLFETGAIRVSQKDRPFWYTSGTIGPYFINTHFLYGSEDLASKFLKDLEDHLQDPFGITKFILEKSYENYQNNRIYREVMNMIISTISKEVGLDKIDIVTGGERRDWFFSVLVAYLLKKPHGTLFKNQDAYLFEESEIVKKCHKDSFKGKGIIHIADLITEASSYSRMWMPAIESFGGTLKNTLAVVDRMQGGGEVLAKKDVKLISLLNVDQELFVNANQLGLIHEDQLVMIIEYLRDHKGSMQKFLDEHPSFIEESLEAEPKIRERAQLCIKNKAYKVSR
jgi:orotate phosphoribosyltransferase